LPDKETRYSVIKPLSYIKDIKVNQLGYPDNFDEKKYFGVI
jgi:hypothetical protein